MNNQDWKTAKKTALKYSQKLKTHCASREILMPGTEDHLMETLDNIHIFPERIHLAMSTHYPEITEPAKSAIVYPKDDLEISAEEIKCFLQQFKWRYK